MRNRDLHAGRALLAAMVLCVGRSAVAQEAAQEAATGASTSTGTGASSGEAVNSQSPTTPVAPTAPTQAQEERAAEEAEDKEAPGFNRGYVGLDLYAGRSNLPGQRAFSDAFWIGSGAAFPSSLYLRFVTRKGGEARLSFGTGDLFRDQESTLRQPLEAWYQVPAGKSKVTLGKHFVPFALQEWQYESKWGARIQRSVGATDIASSLVYDENTHRPNFYARVGRTINDKLSLGVSAGLGRGLSYGTEQDRAFGLDLSAQLRGFVISSEYFNLRRRAADRFYFTHTKIVYDKLDKLKPFVGRYSWNDRGGTFGSFQSSVIGINYQVTPSVSFETAYAHTSDRNVTWFQVHLTPEYKYFDEQKKARRNTIAPGSALPRALKNAATP